MKTIVITGGIGSGKTAACKYLQSEGVPVFYCDDEVKRIYADSPAVVERIEESLGVRISENGILDKHLLASVIFNDKFALEKVENIVFPAVKESFESWKSRISFPFIVIESATITQKRFFDGLYDAVILISSSEDERISRVSERDNASLEDIRSRMCQQKYDESAADIVVNNDDTLESLYKNIKIAINKIL